MFPKRKELSGDLLSKRVLLEMDPELSLVRFENKPPTLLLVDIIERSTALGNSCPAPLVFSCTKELRTDWGSSFDDSGDVRLQAVFTEGFFECLGSI